MSNMKKNTCNERNDKCGIDSPACLCMLLYVCLCNCEYVCNIYLGRICTHIHAHKIIIENNINGQILIMRLVN